MGNSFGGAIKIKGESEYTKALARIKMHLKEVSSEMRIVTNTYAKNDTSTVALTAKQNALSKTLKEQQNLVDTLKNKQADLARQYTTQSQKHDKLVNSYEAEKRKLAEIGRETGETSAEYKAQAKVVASLSSDIKRSSSAVEANEKAMSNMRVELNNAQAAAAKTSRSMEELSDSTRESGESANAATNGGFTVFKGIIADLAANVITSAIGQMRNLATEVVSVGMSFEGAMSQVEAISGASGEDFEKLTDKAKEMGAKTKFSATESAEAFNYMAMAGWKTEDMMNGIEGVMNLAAASGEDLATTSDIVTDALTAMGYKASDAGHLSDVMAAATSNANTNVAMMGETFKYAGALVGAMGYSMEDAAVAVGLMANSGVKASQAGTSLRGILTNLAKPSGEAKKALDELGVSLTESDGSMKSLDTVMQDLRKAFDGLNEAEKSEYATTIAGKNAMTGLLAIVNAAPEDYQKLSVAVQNSEGASARMAETMNDNLAGSLTLVKSQLEGVAINLYDNVKPALNQAVKWFSELVSKADWNAFGKKVKSALDKVMNGLKWIIDHKSGVITALKGVVAAFAVAKVLSWTKALSGAVTSLGGLVSVATTAVKTTGLLTTATKLLGVAFSTNPIGMVLTGATALIGVYKLLSDHTNKETDAQKEQRLAIEEMNEKLKENREQWEEVQKAQQNQLNVSMSEIAHSQALYDELGTLVDANGKVKKGYEERAKYIVGELNDSCNAEIEMNDNVIKEYDKLGQKMDDVFNKKRGEAILNSQADAYEQAVQKELEASENLRTSRENLADANEKVRIAEQNYIEYRKKHSGSYDTDEMSPQLKRDIEDAKKAANDMKKVYDDANEQLSQYNFVKQQYMNNQALYEAGKYDEMSAVTWDYVADAENSGNAEKDLAEKNLANAKTNLQNLLDNKKKYHTDAYDELIKAAKKEIETNQATLDKLNETTKEGLYTTRLIWSGELGQQLAELTNRSVEFKDVGGGHVQMYINGVKSGEPVAASTAEQVAKSCINSIRAKETEAEDAGMFIMEGLRVGIINNAGSAMAAAADVAANVLKTIKDVTKISSPSKVTTEFGMFIDKGLEIGIKDNADGAVKSAMNVAKDTIRGMQTGLSGGVSLSGIVNSARATVPRMPVQTAPQAETISRSESLVNAFKQALKGMKVELDGDEMGRFVDRTVTNLVYN